LKALFELEEAGVGRRKAEGFGRICVSDQFHQEVALK
jgi:CRISPR-associated protein Csx10